MKTPNAILSGYGTTVFEVMSRLARDHDAVNLGQGFPDSNGTTAATALLPVLPDIASRLSGFSYRIPTQIVSSADLSLRLRKGTSVEELRDYFSSCFEDSPYVDLNQEALVGVDFTGNPYSATIDTRWLQVIDDRMVKVVLWYDNEWAYSSRVIDLARIMARFH